MQIIASLNRVVASESVLPIVDPDVPRRPSSPSKLMVSADLHWRRREWKTAIDFASRVLSAKPDNFHALSIVVSSYGHLGQVELAYPHAKRLLLATPPNWTAVKVLCSLLGVSNLVRPRKRESFYRALRRCDIEAQADRKILAWARELVSHYEGAQQDFGQK